MSNRMASSILRAIALDEMCTSSMSDYEELAVALATDSERLFAIRTRLENSRDSCALFDTERWVRNFETALEEMERRQGAGLSPDDIEVSDDGPIAEVREKEILFA